MKERKDPAAVASAARRRLLIVDDHPMTRAGLVQLFEKQEDLTVCGEAGDPAAARDLIAKTSPDLLVTDITMPGRGGIEFVKDVLALHPDLAILVVSMHDELIYAERMLRAGARGYIMKESGGEEMLAAVRQVLGGMVYLSPKMSKRILDQLSGSKSRHQSPIDHLSDREFEIFQLIGNGLGTQDIARQLKISPKTVDVHRGNIKEKLRLPDSVSLIRYAVRWVESEPAPRAEPADSAAPDETSP